ncbi:MAG: hypothetical protein JWM50_1999 [Microbacteriaceae bacterium]|jgi:hypothetical protein|nr:hypothetical protein [Microbacteriaceae bacterium]
MQHILFANKSLLAGDTVTETLMQYAALLANEDLADTVKISAIGIDGESVVVTFLLDNGTNLVAETSRSELEEPDNDDVVTYMRERIMRLSSPPLIGPDDQTMPSNYEDLNLD